MAYQGAIGRTHERIQAWADGFRERGKYTPVGVAFHWGMAALVMAQILTGWWMQRFLVGPAKIDAYHTHASLGLSILFVGVLRLLWRMIVPAPDNMAHDDSWQSTAAHATHVLFYILFALLPLSGWALWSAIQPAEPLYLAGLVAVPQMPFHTLSPEWQYTILHLAERVHVFSVVVLCVLIAAHVGAALKHHFWDQDDVVEGMLPEVPDAEWSLADGQSTKPEDRSPALPEGG